MGRALALPAEPPALEEIRRVVTIFRELRGGVTADGEDEAQDARPARCPRPRPSRWSTTASRWPATSATACCGRADLAAGLIGAVVKDPVQDRVVWLEYLKTVVKERDGWKDLYRACMEVL